MTKYSIHSGSRRSLLPSLILVSLGLHVLLLPAAIMQRNEPSSQPRPVLGLELVQHTSARQQQPTVPDNAKQQARQPDSTENTAKLTTAPETETATATTGSHKSVASQDTQTIDTPRPATVDVAETDPLETLRSTLHRQLAANFRYPLLARKRGMEGNVVLQLRILADGTMQNISVATSSGHRLLDTAAVASARSLTLESGLAGWSNTSIEIHIPIHYRLTDT